MYMSRTYENIFVKIPKAPDPFQLTELKARGFIEFYRCAHATITLGYLKSFEVAFVFLLKENNQADFTKSVSFRNYINGLKRLMKGDTCPNAKKYISIPIIEKLALSVIMEIVDEMQM